MNEETIIPERTENLSSKEMQLADHMLPNHLLILPQDRRPVFPGIVMPLTFSGRDNLDTIREALDKEDGYIGLALSQEEVEEEGEESSISFFEMGTAFQILRTVPIAPGTIQILGQGITRFKKKKTLFVKPHVKWEVEYHRNPKDKSDPELKAYMMALSSDLKELLQMNTLFKEQVNLVVSQLNTDAPGLTMDLIANFLSADRKKLQQLLETIDLYDRAKLILTLIKEELQLARIQMRINKQIDDKVNKQQKEFFLREQLKAIKKELGIEKEDKESDIEKIERKLAEKELTEEAEKVVKEELEKLKLINVQSPEYNVTRSYLETIADLPWGEFSEDNQDIKRARKILDEDHYGLQEVKDAILEFLSTIVRRSKVSGSILCLIGPPGVGKTSIGKSIARAMDRKFFRFSVGGMRDEAEIKGHRRTYIGAMPGKLIQSLKRVGTSNPVVMLDEIDKIGTGFRGDPASALLEVLDPEQNSNFLDHYLDIQYDLSNIMFITTANQWETIPPPLLDRMEIIRLSGYILEEKVEIAKRYLVPKQLKEHGFEDTELQFTDGALALIVDKYAREAGVRNLEKQIRKVIRKAALKLAEEEEIEFIIDEKVIAKYLGRPFFHTEKLYEKSIPGVVLGLAYTSLGGVTLYIEAAGIKTGKSGFQLTGQLGKVMQESAQIAYSYVRSILSKEEDYNKYFEEHLIHLHVPAGATPKDGPSAGITMALGLYSLITGKAIRSGLAMTGELTLTGKVLPIGGVKEKVIAARRVDVMEVILPIDNQKDFEELQDYIREGITVNYADYFVDVIKVAYTS